MAKKKSKKPKRPKPSAVTRGVGRPILGASENGKTVRRPGKRD